MKISCTFLLVCLGALVGPSLAQEGDTLRARVESIISSLATRLSEARTTLAQSDTTGLTGLDRLRAFVEAFQNTRDQPSEPEVATTVEAADTVAAQDTTQAPVETEAPTIEAVDTVAAQDTTQAPVETEAPTIEAADTVVAQDTTEQPTTETPATDAPLAQEPAGGES